MNKAGCSGTNLHGERRSMAAMPFRRAGFRAFCLIVIKASVERSC
ncbi:MAG: hypothetical protein ACR2RF_33740 [Geminicoccaceae bacterium]